MTTMTAPRVNEALEAARLELQALRGTNPALDFVPNIGQERLLDAFSGRNGHYPFIGVIGAGNGLGKTSLMANMMVGCAYGPDEVSPWMERYGLWQREVDWRAREGKPSAYRLVCHADAMKEGGPVLQAIKEWFPKGRYKLDKAGKTFYSSILCFDTEGNVCATFDVKTHDQSKVAQAGTNLNGVFHDEPPPEENYAETVGRCRREGAFILFFLTPLEMAGWMIDQLIDEAALPDDPRPEIVVVHGSIWDNCKDIPGTRGKLSRETIERQIRQWGKISPAELDARVNGTFTHLSGAIYKKYRPAIHEVEDFPIPPWWPIYRIIDPHDTKLPAIIWVAQSETDAVVIREWPTDDYVKLGNSSMTISQIVNLCKRDIEAPFRKQILWGYMDPNKGKTPHRGVDSTKTVQDEYREAGWDFDLAETDDLAVGHGMVQALLHYDETLPIGDNNRPYLRVMKHCRNTSIALQRYGIKKDKDVGASLTTRLDKKYKDFADPVRYFAVKRQAFRRVDEALGFYQALMSGRVRK